MKSEVENISHYDRWDAEYFEKNYLQFLYKNRKISNDKLGSLCIQINRNPMMYGFEYSDKGIPYIRIDDLMNPFINIENSVKISEEVNNTFHSTQLKNKDIVMGVRGNTIGRLGIYFGIDKLANISPNCIYFRMNNKERAEYISLFLISKYGLMQINHSTSGTGQPTITSTELSEISIPKYDNGLENIIKEFILESYQQIEHSKSHYIQAEQLLLQELGINETDWQTKGITTNIKTFKESFAYNSRLDAEYFQPKYEILERGIKSYKEGFGLINDFLKIPIKSGTTPKSVVDRYNVKNNYFVRIEAFNEQLGIDETLFHSIDDEDFEKYISNKVEQNDILVSMTGTIGNVAIYSPKKPALINQNIMRLRINKELINIETLALYLKSIGKILLERVQTGNVQPYVNTQNFETLIVPRISFQIQEQIASLIQQSFQLRNQSKHLLDIAKQAVEMAIEADEATALAFIKANTDLE